MEKKSVFASIALCLAAALLSCGSVYLGYFSFPKLKQSSVIYVKGLVERNVTADRAVIVISVDDEDDNVEKLVKLVEGKVKNVMKIVEKCGLKESVIDENGGIRDYEKRNKYKNGKICEEVQIYRKWESIKLKTTDVNKAKQLVHDVKELCRVSKGVEVDVVYEFSKFQKMRKEMLCDAIANARELADLVAEKGHLKIIGMENMNQGYVEIKAADECEVSNENRWDSEARERESCEKKLRLVVHAGFKIANE